MKNSNEYKYLKYKKKYINLLKNKGGKSNSLNIRCVYIITSKKAEPQFYLKYSCKNPWFLFEYDDDDSWESLAKKIIKDNKIKYSSIEKIMVQPNKDKMETVDMKNTDLSKNPKINKFKIYYNI